MKRIETKAFKKLSDEITHPSVPDESDGAKSKSKTKKKKKLYQKNIKVDDTSINDLR